jgi:hypothetical protein
VTEIVDFRTQYTSNLIQPCRSVWRWRGGCQGSTTVNDSRRPSTAAADLRGNGLWGGVGTRLTVVTVLTGIVAPRRVAAGKSGAGAPQSRAAVAAMGWRGVDKCWGVRFCVIRPLGRRVAGLFGCRVGLFVVFVR